jgi:hypothetical protein
MMKKFRAVDTGTGHHTEQATMELPQCFRVIASEAKQSMPQRGDRWIASSLRSSQ